MRKAYLIVALDRENKCLGYDIFSEKNPTRMGDTVLGVVAEAEAPTYQEARDKLMAYIAAYYPWIKVHRG